MISKRRLFGISWLDVLDNARDESIARFKRTDELDVDFSRTDKISPVIERTKQENAEFVS